MRVLGRVVLALVVLSLCPGLQATASATRFQGTTYPAGTSPNSVAVGDFDGDGIIDLAVADSCLDLACVQPGAVAVLLGNGDGTFRKGKKYLASGTGGSSVFVITADFNRDGKLDLAVLNQGVNVFGDLSILLGNGDGSFQAPIAYTVGGAAPTWAAAGDFNGDQVTDIAVSLATTDAISILLGNADGTFQAATKYHVGSSPQGLTVADFNNDGHLDVVVANECGQDPSCGKGTLSILLGNGDGTFNRPVSFAAGLFPLQVEAADFNRDGNLDLAVSLPCGSDQSCGSFGAIGILLGNGHGSFGPVTDYIGKGFLTARFAIGDLNSDSRVDVLGLNYQDASATVFLGGGDGSLQAIKNYAVGINPISSVTADLNNDGAADFVIAAQQSNAVSVFLNINAR